MNCTFQRRNGTFCDAPTNTLIPASVCAEHAILIHRLVQGLIADARNDPSRASGLLGEIARQSQSLDNRRWQSKPRRQVVYYVRIGSFIKIGYTANLETRLHAYGPTVEVLAVEPGDMTVEKTRLRQFEHLLAAGREWFEPGADLLDHIASLRVMTP